MKDLIKKYLAYLIRWQLSTPILAPVIAYFKHSPSLFGTKEDWIGSAVANLIGGLIFFWVDKWIFKSTILAPLWEIKENIKCADCGKLCRGYRVVKAGNYDRMQDVAPQFRCEDCSKRKLEELKQRGIKI
ncbi:MAG: hypothetical protein PHF44_00665 [Candidatus Pacebacteria bacterium]|nr:hypothetical protein [Candidatus Paceibacterota bacterium]